jgi:hypothetical protein
MSEPLQPKTVPFYGDELVAVEAADGAIYLHFAKACENLGMARRGQVTRVERHAVLREGLVTLTIQTTGGPQDVQCLRVDLLPLWLAGIQASRVKAELQDKLIRYQAEAAHVLWRAFRAQIIVEPSTQPSDESATSIAHLERIIEQSRAMQRMAEEQIALIRRVDIAARIVKGLQGDVADIQVRLGVLEQVVRPGAPISKAQAAEISQKVKALAELLTGMEKGKNFYQGIFGELYRRFLVSSYTDIPQELFADVLAFLDDWRRAADSGSMAPPA